MSQDDPRRALYKCQGLTEYQCASVHEKKQQNTHFAHALNYSFKNNSKYPFAFLDDRFIGLNYTESFQ